MSILDFFRPSRHVLPPSWERDLLRSKLLCDVAKAIHRFEAEDEHADWHILPNASRRRYVLLADQIRALLQEIP